VQPGYRSINGLIGPERTEHGYRILYTNSLKGDGQFRELRQGEKTSSIEVGERKKFIVIKSTTEAIVVLVVSVSTALGRCFLALVLFHLLYYLSLRHTRDISRARL
jgi:hypothetical protein